MHVCAWLCSVCLVLNRCFFVSPVIHHKHVFSPWYTRNEQLTSPHLSDSYTQACTHQFWRKSHIYFNIFNHLHPSVPSHQSFAHKQAHACCAKDTVLIWRLYFSALYKQPASFTKQEGQKSNEWLFHHNCRTFWPYKHHLFLFSLKAGFNDCSGFFALKPSSHARSTCCSLKQHSLVPLCALFCPQKNCPGQDASWMLGTKQGNQTSPGKLYQLSYQDSGSCCLLHWVLQHHWHLGCAVASWRRLTLVKRNSALTDNLHR